MDLHNNSHPESGRLEQIISQFLLKSLHIILDSRIPSLHPHDRSGDFQSSSRVRKSDKWFNLVLGDRPAALDNLNFWQRNVMDPMIIDIILVRRGTTSSSVDDLYSSMADRTPIETVMERWIVQYNTQRVMAPQTGESSASCKKTYKKSTILLQEEMMKEYSFMPVEALPGHLSLSVTFRPSLSDFNLEPLATFPPKIITDYVGSPTTDPLRSFPSSDRGDRATSFPLKGIRPLISTPFQRPHSWTSGFHRAAPFMANQSLGGSPPAYRTSPMPYNFPHTPSGTYGTEYKAVDHQLTKGLLILKDGKDDSGRFSGLLSSSGSPHIGFSRSSSRLSFQDDLDDGDFSCPFDVDDVDTSDSPNSQKLDGKKNLESTPHSLLMGKQSQDAAVGVLVHMLRTALPLRQDPSCYSSHSLRTDLDEGVATASGFFMPRKTADALEELRSYREMKDLLLSKSGTRVASKEEA
ncbi:hypothetical protein GH714_008137 [Hevea brasiliensis]|uniref:Autophagy-related protein 13 N-terminal domain-containing protein n=1 Tax=Hevea brasiliensis TaxID=3981 RepID=A0A6A6NGA1_HEVBR|nr:hypothetical protein GH714_008137 [Hevea brasiliensis]